MIYIKTKLKKIPTSCKACPFSFNYQYASFAYRNDFVKQCFITKKECPMEKSQHGNMKYILPTWCPLYDTNSKR